MIHLFYCFSILIITGCFNADVDNSIEISGEIVSYDTLDPIENARIDIFGGDSNGLNGTTFFFVDSIFSDENGSFTWDSKNAPLADLYAIKSVKKENYFDLNEDVLILGNYAQIILDPHAWLHLSVVNDPSIPGDYFKTNATFIPGQGIIGEFENIYMLRGGRKIGLSTKDSLLGEFKKDSILLNPLDTTLHKILF